MKTLIIGIASFEEIKKWTLSIAKGEYKPTKKDPKIWFSSMESLAQVLSEKNRELLGIISAYAPQSLKELSILSRRHESNLSRTLKTMQQYGFIELIQTTGKEKIPRVTYEKLHVNVNLANFISKF